MEISINVNAPAGAKIDKKITPIEYFGIILAIVVVIAILIAVIYCCLKKRKGNATKYQFVHQDQNETLTGSVARDKEIN